MTSRSQFRRYPGPKLAHGGEGGDPFVISNVLQTFTPRLLTAKIIADNTFNIQDNPLEAGAKYWATAGA